MNKYKLGDTVYFLEQQSGTGKLEVVEATIRSIIIKATGVWYDIQVAGCTYNSKPEEYLFSTVDELANSVLTLPIRKEQS